MSVLKSAAGEIRVAGFDAPVGATVRVRIRARDVMIATERPRGLSALNILQGKVRDINAGDGALADVLIDCNGQGIAARITRQSSQVLGLTSGQDVFAVIKTVSFDRANTARSIGASDDADIRAASQAFTSNSTDK